MNAELLSRPDEKSQRITLKAWLKFNNVPYMYYLLLLI